MPRDYRVLKHIGTGSFGKVYKVEDSNKNIYAMKEIAIPKMDRSDKQAIINEIAVQKLHSSPFIIKYFGSFYENDKTSEVIAHLRSKQQS